MLYCVELKAREFDPRDAGQLNFILSVIDDVLRSGEDKPTIGCCYVKPKIMWLLNTHCEILISQLVLLL